MRLPTQSPNRRFARCRPQLELLEDRLVPSGNPPVVTTNLPDLVRGPNEEINLTISVTDNDAAASLDWNAVWGTKAYLTDRVLELQNTSNYSYNWSGTRFERWVEAGDGTWYFILPDGEFHLWNGSNDAVGPLILNLDPIYYLDPFLLTNADNANNLDTNQFALDMAWVLDTNLNFLDPNQTSGLWQNSGGRGERWLLGNDLLGRTQWFFILPNGELYQWDNNSAAQGWLMAVLDPMYYEVEMLQVLAAAGGVPAPTPPDVEVAFVSNTSSTYSNDLVITPTNYRGTVSVMAEIFDGTGTGDSRIFDVTFSDTPPTLPNPGTIFVTAGVNTFNLGGSDDDTGDDAYLTYDIGFARPFLGPDYLNVQLPPLTYYSVYDGYFGAGNRWYQAQNGNWFWMNSDGELYQYFGAGWATGDYLGRLTPEHVANPQRLQFDTNSPPPAGALLTVNDSGQVTLTMPAGFAGNNYAIIATLSDGMMTSSRRFVVTVQ